MLGKSQELRWVTAVDMPAEAILQRPSVLQHVLPLLKPADKGSNLPTAALDFLLCFVRRIKKALGMALDPELVPTTPGVYYHTLTTCLLVVCCSILKLLLPKLWDTHHTQVPRGRLYQTAMFASSH